MGDTSTHELYKTPLCVSDLMTNKPLQEVLYMVLVAGNFLNSVRNSVCFNMVTSLLGCDTVMLGELFVTCEEF